ncbi:MAG TPA: hypothetical protein DET40_25455 [Lentisphaeria bacterium]|nr:MAG: hypothetical protein A2X45_18510 [Lentisphaerae bacterium GWF2_50_93]HCE46908.1 hypothetical protein [Lentisphaeria bacterium]
MPIYEGILKLDAEHYFEASRYRIETARQLYDKGKFSAAIYFAGVAVECIFRAYIYRKDLNFDSRHDLESMYKGTGMCDLINSQERRNMCSYLGILWTRWKNNYRYTSDDRLRSEFSRLKYYKYDNGTFIQGNHLKENSRMVVDAAVGIHALGERKWQSKKK